MRWQQLLLILGLLGGTLTLVWSAQEPHTHSIDSYSPGSAFAAVSAVDADANTPDQPDPVPNHRLFEVVYPSQMVRDLWMDPCPGADEDSPVRLCTPASPHDPASASQATCGWNPITGGRVCRFNATSLSPDANSQLWLSLDSNNGVQHTGALRFACASSGALDQLVSDPARTHSDPNVDPWASAIQLDPEFQQSKAECDSLTTMLIPVMLQSQEDSHNPSIHNSLLATIADWFNIYQVARTHGFAPDASRRAELVHQASGKQLQIALLEQLSSDGAYGGNNGDGDVGVEDDTETDAWRHRLDDSWDRLFGTGRMIRISPVVPKAAAGSDSTSSFDPSSSYCFSEAFLLPPGSARGVLSPNRLSRDVDQTCEDPAGLGNHPRAQPMIHEFARWVLARHGAQHRLNRRPQVTLIGASPSSLAGQVVVNEAEMANALKQQVTAWSGDFDVIHPHELDFEQLLHAIARTDVLVGFQGDPALALAVFLRPEAFLLEIATTPESSPTASQRITESLSAFLILRHEVVELSAPQGDEVSISLAPMADRVTRLLRMVPGAAMP